MKPYYSESGIEIYCGDAREVLPTLTKADLALTDPPYGIGRDGKRVSTSSHGGTKAYEFMGWDSKPPEKELFELIFKASHQQIIWGANYFSQWLPPARGWLVWDKGQRLDQADAELAFSSIDQPVRVNVINRVQIAIDGAVHPTQKPLALMKWCIGFAVGAQTVLDPFMGSGTTLRAAKDLGLKAIGIEIEERYCEIAAKRLAQQVLDFGVSA